jgi:endonuclease YncB( thermonuclease family)
LRSIFSLFVLLIMIAAAWLYAGKADTKETIISTGQTIRAADGDSFMIGPRKLRLYGIDAPELKQTCSDAAGQAWRCGAAAHGALITLLAQPGLTCQANAQDRFGRSLATCSAINTADIAAVQVRSGMAVSNEFNGMREYGAEEDEARAAKIGIWQGSITGPKEWRASHGRGEPKAELKPTF